MRSLVVGTLLVVNIFTTLTLDASKKKNVKRGVITPKKSEPKWNLRFNEINIEEKKEEMYRELLLWEVDGEKIKEEKLKAVFESPMLNLDTTVTGTGIPSTKKPCRYFDPCFNLLTEESLERGINYAEGYCEDFEYAERIGITTPAIMLGILRIETNFGKYTGYRLLANTFFSIYALSLRPGRRSWAMNEMGYFLQYVVGDKDPFSFFGSWAGAFGIVQFMPSSYFYCRVDGDDDGVMDLMNPRDANRSMARYLKRNGIRGIGLNKKRWSKEKAVQSYNPGEKGYSRPVLAYTAAVEKRLEKGFVKKSIKKSPKRLKKSKKSPRVTRAGISII